LDLLLPVLGVLVAVIAIAAVFWYRKRKIEHAHASLQRAAEDLGHIETALDPFLRTGDYIPERVRKPLHEKASQVAQEVLPPIAKIAQRSRNISMRDQFGGVNRKANELSKLLREHNEGYVQRRIAEHSTLLVKELNADEAQRVAIVRDDERNFIIVKCNLKQGCIVRRRDSILERPLSYLPLLRQLLALHSGESVQFLRRPRKNSFSATIPSQRARGDLFPELDLRGRPSQRRPRLFSTSDLSFAATFPHEA